MKKLLLFTLLLVAFAFFSKAQTVDWLWAKGATGIDTSTAQCLVTDALGNVYVAGYFQRNTITFGSTTLTCADTSNLTMFLVKYDAGGNVLWAKSPGGNNAYNFPNAITTDASGNIYVTGIFRNNITFGSIALTDTSGMSNMFVVKYNSAGNVLWAKAIEKNATIASSSITADPSGSIYITGYFFSATVTFGTTTLTNNSTSFVGINAFLVKYDSSGNVRWAKGIGGIYQDYGFSVSATRSGYVYLTGSFSSPSLTFGSTTLTNSYSATDPLNLFVVKYDTSGSVIWAQSAGSDDNIFSSVITTDASDNAYVAGYFYSSLFTLGSTTLNNSGIKNTFVTKFDKAGNVQWAKSANGSDYTAANYISADTAGNTYVTGYFDSDSIRFDSYKLTNDTTDGYSDIYLVKYDPNGNVVWANSEGGNNEDQGFATAADNAGNVYVAGYFDSKSISFGSTTLTNLAASNNNMFIAKYGSIATGVSAVSPINDGLNIFPNPSSGKFIVQLTGEKTSGILEVYNVLGESIYQSVLPKLQTGNLFQIDLSGQPAGLYLVQLKSGENVEMKKVMTSK